MKAGHSPFGKSPKIICAPLIELQSTDKRLHLIPGESLSAELIDNPLLLLSINRFAIPDSSFGQQTMDQLLGRKLLIDVSDGFFYYLARNPCFEQFRWI